MAAAERSPSGASGSSGDAGEPVGRGGVALLRIDHCHHEVGEQTCAAAGGRGVCEGAARLLQAAPTDGHPAPADRGQTLPRFADVVAEDILEHAGGRPQVTRPQVGVGERHAVERRQGFVGAAAEREQRGAVAGRVLHVANERTLPAVVHRLRGRGARRRPARRQPQS